MVTGNRGENPYVLASWLLANTSKLNLATGIANIYHREPTVSRALQYTLAEQSGDRFLMAIGVSHKPLVEGVRKLEYAAGGHHAQLLGTNGHRALSRGSARSRAKDADRSP